MKFNYVIFGGSGYYLIGYRDIMSLPNVKYFSTYLDGQSSWWKKMLITFTFSQRVNSCFRFPLLHITQRFIFPVQFDRSQPICFIFWDGYYGMSKKYIDYLKKKYPYSVFVLYTQDKIRFINSFNVAEAKQYFNIIYSYDRQDCEEYGLIYYPTPFSKIDLPDNIDVPDTDVFYCGKAKTRFKTILQTYMALKQVGLKCDFYLTSVPDDCPIVEGVHYNENLDYISYLQHLSHSKCVLEIMQEGADGFTPRLWESIMFDKHFITNNDSVISSPFFNESYMHSLNTNFSSLAELIKVPALYNDEIKKKMSPINFLYDIESRL